MNKLHECIAKEELCDECVDLQFCSDWLKKQMHELFDRIKNLQLQLRLGRDTYSRGKEEGARQEREFWIKKFKHWTACRQGGNSTDHIWANGFKDCYTAMEENDRWLPANLLTPEEMEWLRNKRPNNEPPTG